MLGLGDGLEWLDLGDAGGAFGCEVVRCLHREPGAGGEEQHSTTVREDGLVTS